MKANTLAQFFGRCFRALFLHHGVNLGIIQRKNFAFHSWSEFLEYCAHTPDPNTNGLMCKDHVGFQVK